ncbi:MAG TPA: dockerin type I repeat-containing protein [Thermoanaerobaculia bacterium]|nr:dockerin type I repeat-containing protein [Thermoanaerobaculia bacterium]
MRSRARLFALLALLVFAAAPARAAGPTFVVDSTADQHDLNPGDGLCQAAFDVCTLRAAIEEANTTTDALIQVPEMTIPLGIGDLLVSSSMKIEGAGMKKTVVAAASGFRIFTLSVDSIGLALANLTLKDGSLTGGAGGAVALTYPASLDMDHVLVTNCSAPYAGGVYTTGDFTISNSVFEACHATKAGGVGGQAGAIYIGPSGSGSALGIIETSTFHQNTSIAAGGAIDLLGGYGILDLANCTVSGNHAGGGGGGIRVEGGTLNLDHVTVTDNVSDIFAGGGGLSNGAAASAATFINSIIASNYDVNNNFLVDGDCAGAVTSQASCNILGPSGTPHCTVSGTYSAATPSFGPLQDNGGATPTHALLAGSAGVDGPGCILFHPILTDQRGVHRVGVADLGAYERAPCGDVNGDGTVDVSDVFFLINALFAGGAVPPGLANVNGDSSLDVSDVFYLINRLFAGGSAPTCPGT